MEIKTKYNIGDTVYYIACDDIDRLTINKIEIDSEGKIKYGCKERHESRTFSEEDFYLTECDARAVVNKNMNDTLNNLISGLNKSDLTDEDFDLTRFKIVREYCKKLNKKFIIKTIDGEE